MSIPEIEPVKNHYGNNSATSFDFDFYIERSSQLKVQHTDLNGILTTLKENVDYSIHEIGNENGSYITFPIQGSTYSALAWDTSTDKKELLTISLNLPLKQEFEFDISGDLDKHQLEKALDYQMRIDQILNRKINRAVLVPEGSELTPSEMIETIHNSRITAVQAANDAKNSANEAKEQLNNVNKRSEEVIQAYTDAKTDITNLKDSSVEEIKAEGAEQINNIKKTGFYIHNDKLYYIDSNGETQEFGGGGGLEVCDIGMALFIDETKGLRRRLNGQIIAINDNTQYFLTRLKRITTLYPSLLTDEATWQSDKTLSAYGQVGRFVFNYASDGVTVESVRLPAVVNVQGLMDLANTGFTVPAGLPTLYTNSTGAHYHDRGTMNITGAIYNSHYGDNNGSATADSTGAFSRSGAKPSMTVSGVATNIYGVDYHFNAANSWTGVTSTNGEHSHSIAGTSNTVQPEAIQYPYFIQIATGQETEVDIVNTIELNTPYSLFDCKFADHKLNNLSWLRSSESGQYNDGSVYSDAYNELISEYNNAESVEETDNGIIYKRTPKGYKIALDSQKTAIDNLYSSAGVAWFYVINQSTQQFALPRTKSGFNGIRNKVGDYISESLPNITANFQMPVADSGASGSGAIVKSGASIGTSIPAGYQTNAQGAYNEGGIGIIQYNFDASRFSSTYQNNKAVQQRGTEMYLYFYVGETVQNPNLIDAGRLAENMANRNLSNLSDFGKIMCAKNAFAQIHYDPHDFSKIGAYWSAGNLTSGSVNIPDGGFWLTFIYKYNAATEAGLINSVFELGIVPGGKKFTVEGNYPHYYFYGIRIQEA